VATAQQHKVWLPGSPTKSAARRLLAKARDAHGTVPAPAAAVQAEPAEPAAKPEPETTAEPANSLSEANGKAAMVARAKALKVKGYGMCDKWGVPALQAAIARHEQASRPTPTAPPMPSAAQTTTEAKAAAVTQLDRDV